MSSYYVFRKNKLPSLYFFNWKIIDLLDLDPIIRIYM